MTKTPDTHLTRRNVLAGAGAATLAMGQSAAARVEPGTNSDFVYEVQKTEAEWLEQFGPKDYDILRLGYTETPKSSPHWNEDREGMFHCRGCDLPIYDSKWKIMFDGKGWVFFLHGQPDAILMNVDGHVPEYGQMAPPKEPLVEVHCSRCGCHQGHYLIIEGKMAHCINGAAMTFNPRVT